MKEEINQARSIERLYFIAEIIRIDYQEKADWTEEYNLNELRKLWKNKMEELEEKKA